MPVPELLYVQVERSAERLATILPRLQSWDPVAWEDFHREGDAFQIAVDEYRSAKGWLGPRIPPPFDVSDLPPWLDVVRETLDIRLKNERLANVSQAEWILEFAGALGLWWEASREVRAAGHTLQNKAGQSEDVEVILRPDLTPAIRVLTNMLRRPIPIPVLTVTDEVPDGARTSLTVLVNQQPVEPPINRREATTLQRLLKAAPGTLTMYDCKDPLKTEAQKDLIRHLKAALARYGEFGEWIGSEIERVNPDDDKVHEYRLVLPPKTLVFDNQDLDAEIGK